MDLAQAADRLNRIDIYTSTLEGVRRGILKIIEAEIIARLTVNVEPYRWSATRMKDKNPERKTAVEDKNARTRTAWARNNRQRQQTVGQPIRKEPAVPAADRAQKNAASARHDLPEHFIERRRRPRISTEQPPPPAPPHLDDYAPIIGKPELDEIRFLARNFAARP